ncbi:MAG: energy-coupling factor transporter ATPase, partial [Clostridia bacterium]|nr:energy-coupling factor transporter ATPase [Clostridia bacterium]
FNGLLPNEKGCVTVDGHDLSDKKERSTVRSLVGMVFQYPEYQLFAETVFEDIAFGPKNMKLDEEEIKRRVLQAMELVGLDAERFSAKSPFELSGGEKRRVALAGVLAMEPKYLVLDEPMAGLDPSGRKSILTILERLRAEAGCTIVMISHSMEDIARHATQLLVLDHGKIKYLDTPQNVFLHTQELFDLGLSVPQMTYLSMLLRQKGFDAPIVSDDEQPLVDWLVRSIRHA